VLAALPAPLTSQEEKMRIEELELKDGEWTNETGQPVELNPPGVVVAPGARIVVSETGAVTLHAKVEEKTAAAKEEPKVP
jgi:hypothetical protein